MKRYLKSPKLLIRENGYSLAEIFFLLFALGSLVTGVSPDQKASITEDVYAIDQKLDDGNGATGIVRAAYTTEMGADLSDFCVDGSGVYRITEDTPLICNFVIKY